MSFAARAINPPGSRERCVIGKVLDRLDDNERTHLETMLADLEHWPHAGRNSIQSAIEDEGHGRVGDKAVARHRAGDCRCGLKP